MRWILLAAAAALVTVALAKPDSQQKPERRIFDFGKIHKKRGIPTFSRGVDIPVVKHSILKPFVVKYPMQSIPVGVKIPLRPPVHHHHAAKQPSHHHHHHAAMPAAPRPSQINPTVIRPTPCPTLPAKTPILINPVQPLIPTGTVHFTPTVVQAPPLTPLLPLPLPPTPFVTKPILRPFVPLAHPVPVAPVAPVPAIIKPGHSQHTSFFATYPRHPLVPINPIVPLSPAPPVHVPLAVHQRPLGLAPAPLPFHVNRIPLNFAQPASHGFIPTTIGQQPLDFVHPGHPVVHGQHIPIAHGQDIPIAPQIPIGHGQNIPIGHQIPFGQQPFNFFHSVGAHGQQIPVNVGQTPLDFGHPVDHGQQIPVNVGQPDFGQPGVVEHQTPTDQPDFFNTAVHTPQIPQQGEQQPGTVLHQTPTQFPINYPIGFDGQPPSDVPLGPGEIPASFGQNPFLFDRPNVHISSPGFVMPSDSPGVQEQGNNFIPNAGGDAPNVWTPMSTIEPQYPTNQFVPDQAGMFPNQDGSSVNQNTEPNQGYHYQAPSTPFVEGGQQHQFQQDQFQNIQHDPRIPQQNHMNEALHNHFSLRQHLPFRRPFEKFSGFNQ